MIRSTTTGPRRRLTRRETLGAAPTYYDKIDPLHQRTTFNDWLEASGFLDPLNPVTPVNARYFNHGDLALGRDMNCVQGSGPDPKTACYVTNYGDPANAGIGGPGPAPGDAPAASLQAAISRNPLGLVATVAMEYLGDIGENEVTFYAFDDNGDLLPSVVLDDGGAKDIPGVCLSCHGGTYNSNTRAVVGAHFLPFDLDNLTFDPVQSGFTRNDLEGGSSEVPNAFTRVQGANKRRRYQSRNLRTGGTSVSK